jgi:hypothetical protein
VKKVFEDITRASSQKDYDLLLNYLDSLIQTATQEGYLSEQNANNEYTREIGRVARLCARYENEFMTFDFKIKSRRAQNIQKKTFQPC